MYKTYTKDPGSQLDYVFEWKDWLVEGDQILKSSFTIQEGLDWVAESTDGTKTRVWVTGGTSGQSYLVTNRVETKSNPPRIAEISIEIKCQEL